MGGARAFTKPCQAKAIRALPPFSRSSRRLASSCAPRWHLSELKNQILKFNWNLTPITPDSKKGSGKSMNARPDPGLRSMKEIAQAFDIHYATVSRIVKKGVEKV
jgi:DNA-binding MarR family transcriptional regulator